ncbi:hypothetical protein BC567DRAFT_208321 [Phyllosticta citribraziliensis]
MAIGYTRWTFTHGYNADSGGFLLHPRADGYINTPRITDLEINDDSKADEGAKDLAFWQTCDGHHKPQAVRAPTNFHPHWYISSLLVASGDAAKNPFRNTSLGSVEPTKYSSNEWSGESSQVLSW